MGPPGLLTLLLGITLLTCSVYCDSSIEIAPENTPQKTFDGYLRTLGLEVNEGDVEFLNSRDPCDSQDDGEMKWTRFGAFKCAKLVNELSTFMNARSVCRQEYTRGDIAYPVVMSVDSTTDASDLLSLLSQKGVASVWVDRKDSHPTHSFGSNCSELMIPGSDSQVEEVQFKTDDCAVLKRIVCEKPIPISNVALIGMQLETSDRVKELEQKLGEGRTEQVQLSEAIKSLLESLREEFTGEMAKLGEKYSLDNQKLKEEVKLLEGQADELRNSTEDKQKQTLENSTTKPSVNSSEVTTKKSSTSSPGNVGGWTLGDLMSFDTEQAMGSWYGIEVFKRSMKYEPSTKCEEFIFNQTDTVLQVNRWRWVDSNEKRSANFEFTPDSASPHRWTKEGVDRMWFKTDYSTWGILMYCGNEKVTSCDSLWILSRDRTLEPETLETLRDAADATGFAKEFGGPIDQKDSC